MCTGERQRADRVQGTTERYLPTADPTSGQIREAPYVSEERGNLIPSGRKNIL